MLYTTMNLFSRVFLLSFLIVLPLHADWNLDFDTQTKALINELPPLQSPYYLQEYMLYTRARALLLKDRRALKKIAQTEPGIKRLIFRKEDGLIVKKRRNNHIHDLYIWELSFLVGGSEFITPSFPMELAGKRVIVQKLEPFEHGQRLEVLSEKVTKKVPLLDYWKAHLQVYLLGLSDLANGNIGVSPTGKIRFFDNESSLIYYNKPMRTDAAFTTGFICQSFDWSQYRMPLDKEMARELQAFVQNFSHLEDHLKIYKAHRSLALEGEGFLYRLERVRSFPFREGATFRDFLGWAFPKMSPGLDALNQMVGQILGKKVDHGSALFFMGRWISFCTLSPQTTLALQQWIDTYIE